ncbi:MAG: SAM hydroxide adenosyltransferase [Pseudomonadales bacterium]
MRLTQVPFFLLFLALGSMASAMHHRQVIAVVESVSMDFGNIETNVGTEALESLGLTQGDSFTVQFGERQFKTTLGETYSDVPQGDWIAFITETGKLQIARNYENAAVTLGVKTGDSITLFN